MKLIPLQDITLNSGNVAGSTYDEWSASHGTYSVGNNVKITNSTTGLENEYECLVEHTAATDKNPEDDTTDWLYLGASNKWKMFDGFTNTQTEKATSLVVNITGESYVDALALFNLSGTNVNVITKSGATTISDEDYALDYEIANWFEYFFSDFEYRSDLLIPIPGLYASLTIAITITALSGIDAKCGHCCIGRGIELGNTQYSPKISIADYSAKSTNAFGETYLNQRSYAKRITVDMWLNTAQIDLVNRHLATVRATPCVWQFNNSGTGADTDYESLIIYGFYNDFSIVLQGPVKSACSLEIEGLI